MLLYMLSTIRTNHWQIWTRNHVHHLPNFSRINRHCQPAKRCWFLPI